MNLNEQQAICRHARATAPALLRSLLLLAP